MKAPDKIYLQHYYKPEALSEDWSLVSHPIEKNEEYIRKDALMEWIQEVRAIPHENAITRDLAFQEVVNKLNSI